MPVKKFIRKYQSYAPGVAQGAIQRYKVYKPAIRQLASDVMYLKGIINSEPQRFDFQNQSNFSYTGTVLSLCDIPQGDIYGNRTGNRILPKHLNIRMHINKDTAGVMHNTVRYVLFRWWGESTSAVGVAPIPQEILEVVGTWAAPTSPLNQTATGSKGDRNRRIEVHRTGMVTLDNVSKTSIDVEENISLNGKGKDVKEHIEYYSGATAPPTSGGFYLLLISGYVTAGDVQASVYTTLSYYDN